MFTQTKKLILVSFLPISLFANNFNSSMQSYIDELKIEAKKMDSSFKDFDIKRGEVIFTSKHIGKRGQEVSCTSCHNVNLSSSGKNIFTNKTIKPLAPSTNQKRLTSVNEVKKWLRRNFKDVYVREGSAQEKGDVLYYIGSK